MILKQPFHYCTRVRFYYLKVKLFIYGNNDKLLVCHFPHVWQLKLTRSCRQPKLSAVAPELMSRFHWLAWKPDARSWMSKHIDRGEELMQLKVSRRKSWLIIASPSCQPLSVPDVETLNCCFSHQSLLFCTLQFIYLLWRRTVKLNVSQVCNFILCRHQNKFTYFSCLIISCQLPSLYDKYSACSPRLLSGSAAFSAST